MTLGRRRSDLAQTLAATALCGCLLAFIPQGALAGTDVGADARPARDELAQSGTLDQSYRFDIPAQKLALALVEYSKITGIDVVVDGSLPTNRLTAAFAGDMTARQALDRLLGGSGLTWQVLDSHTVSIVAHQTDQMDQSSSAVMTAPVVISARTMNEPGYMGNPDWVYETPGSTSVITREQMRKVPGRTAGDIFEPLAGVKVDGNQQVPGLSINVRGQQDQGRVNMNIDGARQNYNQSGHGISNSAYVDTALLADVVVEKTDLSGVGGAGTSGGIVTMRTLNTDDILDADEKWGGKYDIRRGTNEYNFAGDISAGMRFSPKFDMAAAVSRKVVGDYKGGTNNPALYTTFDSGGTPTTVSADNGHEAYTYQRQTSGLVKANIHFNEEQDLNLGYVGFTSSFGKTTDANNIYNDFNDVETHTVTAKHHWNPDSEIVDLKSSVWWTRTQNNQYRPPRSNTKAYQTLYRVDTYGFDAENTSRVYPDNPGLENSNVTFDYGVEAFRDEAETSSESIGNQANGAAYELEGSTPSGRRDVYGSFGNATFDYNGIFELTAGLRFDRYQLRGTSYWCKTGFFTPVADQNCDTGGTPVDIDMNGQKVSPSARLAVTPIDGIQFYGSYRENMRPPSIMESMIKGSHVAGVPIAFLPNNNLKAEESVTREVGINFKYDNVLFKQDGFRARIARYHTRIDNYVVLGQVYQPTPGCNFGFCVSEQAEAFVNLYDPVDITGTEIEASYDARTFYIGGTFSQADTDMVGDYNPVIFPLNFPAGTQVYTQGYGNIQGISTVYTLPKRKFTVDGGVRLFDEDLVLGARATFVYPSRNISESSTTVDNGIFYRYRTYDLYGSYEVDKAVSVGFSVNNLTDEAYATGGYVPAPGRTITVSLSGNF
ncbi:TonB-dependent receptor [Thalassospira profundimaris]|nr:TonB-dependent receptor [Thalassospira profundimaris]